MHIRHLPRILLSLYTLGACSGAVVEISSPDDIAYPVERVPVPPDWSTFGTNPLLRNNGSQSEVPVFQNVPPPPSLAALRPRPLVMGYPLIQTKGIARAERFLYIADTGKDATHNESAKIWKLDPATRNLTVLYQGPLLVTGKWLYYKEANIHGPAEVIVSDYGEEPSSRSPGTGVGAKVFAIQLDHNGDANGTRVLFEGPPLRSPEGIVVVGDSVLLADWAAGPVTTIADRNATFRSGKVFQIPIAGGPPIERFDDQEFVTLIGACKYVDEDGRNFIRLIDIDGGYPTGIKYLPQSGLVQFYRSEILTSEPLTFGALEKVLHREEYRTQIEVHGLQVGDILEIQAQNQGVFANGAVVDRIPIFDPSSTQFTVHIESFTGTPKIRFKASVIRDGDVITTALIERLKGLNGATLQDNKHAGAAAADLPTDIPRLAATADGTSQAVYFVAPGGGVPVTIWRGRPFVQPMGVMYSWDASKIWVTDQAAGPNETAGVFEIRLPSPEIRRQLFPRLRDQRPVLPDGVMSRD
ncbi:hypothetical protein QBC34DRAFT_458157 [Podospora aff. communis PSN243]|uniref:Uncharacterized protein n=1 Tax=Podospora aff. communis PSN243 TaxID=3040156 RepID=A0AAV9G3L2_9PEZI|nr:hypothetical protein QBC34DRAFT_458157 [Podospora aff. communis PSN243]